MTTTLLKIGDDVDLDGDGIADGAVSDLNASAAIAPGLDLPRQCTACASVDVATRAGSVEAIVCVPLPAGPGIADLDGDGSVNDADLGTLLAQWGGPGTGDLDCSGVVDGADLGALGGVDGPRKELAQANMGRHQISTAHYP